MDYKIRKDKNSKLFIHRGLTTSWIIIKMYNQVAMTIENAINLKRNTLTSASLFKIMIVIDILTYIRRDLFMNNQEILQEINNLIWLWDRLNIKKKKEKIDSMKNKNNNIISNIIWCNNKVYQIIQVDNTTTTIRK